MISVDIKELSNDLWNVLDGLKMNDGCVITEGKKPRALLIEIPEGQLEELLLVIKRARAMSALVRLRSHAAEHGFFTEEEIEAEIQSVRHGKRF